MTLLDKPATVNREAERLYLYAPGEVCVDLTSGTPEDRARVMALLENMREAYALLRDFYKNYEMGSGPDAKMGVLLRAAGLLEDGE